MRCSSRGFENPEGMKFCKACGTELVSACLRRLVKKLDEETRERVATLFARRDSYDPGHSPYRDLHGRSGALATILSGSARLREDLFLRLGGGDSSGGPHYWLTRLIRAPRHAQGGQRLP